jgi:hypothetical protein
MRTKVERRKETKESPQKLGSTFKSKKISPVKIAETSIHIM